MTSADKASGKTANNMMESPKRKSAYPLALVLFEGSIPSEFGGWQPQRLGHVPVSGNLFVSLTGTR